MPCTSPNGRPVSNMGSFLHAGNMRPLHRGIHSGSTNITYVTPDLSPAESPLPSPRGGGILGNVVWRRMGYDSDESEESDEEFSKTASQRDEDLSYMRKRYYEAVWSMGAPLGAPPMTPYYLKDPTGAHREDLLVGTGPHWAVVEASFPQQVAGVTLAEKGLVQRGHSCDQIAWNRGLEVMREILPPTWQPLGSAAQSPAITRGGDCGVPQLSDDSLASDRSEDALPPSAPVSKLQEMRRQFEDLQHKIRYNEGGLGGCYRYKTHGDSEADGVQYIPLAHIQQGGIRDGQGAEGYFEGEKEVVVYGEEPDRDIFHPHDTRKDARMTPLPQRVEYALRDSGYGLKKAKCSAPLSSLRLLSQPKHKVLGSRNYGGMPGSCVMSKSKPIVAVADDGLTVERRMVRPFSTQGIISLQQSKSLKQSKSSDAAARGEGIIRGADYRPRRAEQATRDKHTTAVRRDFGGEAVESLRVKTGRHTSPKPSWNKSTNLERYLQDPTLSLSCSANLDKAIISVQQGTMPPSPSDPHRFHMYSPPKQSKVAGAGEGPSGRHTRKIKHVGDDDDLSERLARINVIEHSERQEVQGSRVETVARAVGKIGRHDLAQALLNAASEVAAAKMLLVNTWS